MIAKTPHNTVIFYTVLNKEHCSKVAVGIMFLTLIKQTAKKSKCAPPYEEKWCKILAKGKKLRGINGEH